MELAEHVFACVGLQVWVKAGDSRFEAVGEDYVAVIGPLRSAAIRPDDKAVGDAVAELAEPGEGGLLDVAFRDAAHDTFLTIFSASRMRISPDISLGSRRSRVLTRLLAS